MFIWSRSTRSCSNGCRPPCRVRRPLGRAVSGQIALATVLLFCLMCLAGCSEAQLDSAVKKIISRPSPRQQVLIALEASDPDVRLDALRGLVRRKEVREDWAVKALDAIARTDPEPQVRCLALRGLMRSGDPRAVDTALAVLNPAAATQPARPADAEVRLDAVCLLARYVESGSVPADRAAAVTEALLSAASAEKDRRVKMAAIRALGQVRDERCLKVLVDALDDDDFGVVYEAEMALRRLTGHTGNFERRQWEAWLLEATDPFSGGVALAERKGRSEGNFWHRLADTLNAMWVAWQGQAKPTGKPSQEVRRSIEAQHEQVGTEPVE